MKYKEFNKATKLPKNFELRGEETDSNVEFNFQGKELITIDTNHCNFSRQEVFNLAMILLKVANEMSDYKD